MSRKILLLPSARRLYAGIVGALSGLTVAQFIEVLPNLADWGALRRRLDVDGGPLMALLSGAMFGALVGGAVFALAEYLASRRPGRSLALALRAGLVHALLYGGGLWVGEDVFESVTARRGLSRAGVILAHVAILAALGGVFGLLAFFLGHRRSRSQILHQAIHTCLAGIAIGGLLGATASVLASQQAGPEARSVEFSVVGALLGWIYSYLVDIWKMVSLQVKGGLSAGLDCGVRQGSNTIGSGTPSFRPDVLLSAEDGVDVFHAEVLRSPARLSLFNRSRTAAIRVTSGAGGGVSLEPGQEHALQHGDSIEIGRAVLLVSAYSYEGQGAGR